MNIRKLPLKTAWVLVLITMIYLGIAYLSKATTYYVAPNGNDANPGTIAQPWATIHKAAVTAQAGDTVYIRGGVYHITKPIELLNTGNNWLTYTTYQDEKVIIDASARSVGKQRGEHLTAPYLQDEGAVQINDQKYLRIQGLTVQNSHNAGFIVRKCQHLELLNNTTNNTHSSGIGIWYSKQVKILNNKVIKANTKAMDDVGDERRGPHEAITISGTDDFEVAYNEIYDSEKEGICVKQASSHGSVHHNYIHHLTAQGIYVDGHPYLLKQFKNPKFRNGIHFIQEYDGTIYNKTRDEIWTELYPKDQNQSDSIRDIEVYENIIHDCSMGITVSSEAGTLVDGVNIHHNLVYNNRNAGIHLAAYFGKNGPRSNIQVYNNTVHHNGYKEEFWWSSGGIFLETHQIKNVVIRNNICTDNGLFQIGTTGQDFAKLNIIIDYNLYHGEMENKALSEIHQYDKKPKHPIYATPGTHSITGVPWLRTEDRNRFYLHTGSPALNAGHPDAKYNDPNGSRNDLGAYPYEAGAN